MHPNCLHLYKTEKALSSLVASCYPRDWNEDFITRSMLRLLLSQTQAGLFSSGMPFRVAWDAFKVSGKLEYSGGDVLILVRVSFPGGRELTGYAFLEAKRIYPNGTYQELSSSQLTRQIGHHPAHMLLLYDQQPQPVMSSHCSCGPCGCEKAFALNSTAVIVVPAPHAVSLASKARGVSNFGYSFVGQLCLRYFRGLDLDFDVDRVLLVLDQLPDVASYVLVANVHLGSTDSTHSTLYVKDLIGRKIDPLPE